MRYGFIVLQLCLLILIFLFYYKSGTSKLRYPSAFVKMLQEYGIAQNNILAGIIASFLIIMELLTSVCILLVKTRCMVAMFGIVLQISYILVIALNYGRIFKNSCGCFELNFPQKPSFKSILINSSIVLMFIAIILLQKEEETLKWNLSFLF